MAFLLALNVQEHVPGIISQLSYVISACAKSEENSQRHTKSHFPFIPVTELACILLIPPHCRTLVPGRPVMKSARFTHTARTPLCGGHVCSCGPFLGSVTVTLRRLMQPVWFTIAHFFLARNSVFLGGSCGTVLMAS